MPRTPRRKVPVDEAGAKQMLQTLLHKQKTGLHSMKFHLEVSLAAGRTTKPRKTIMSHMRIALRGLEVDYKAVTKKLEKLNGTGKSK